MRRRTIVIMSVLFLVLCMSFFLLPKFYAAFNQVDDLTVQASEETIQQEENLTLTVQDQSETDTKVTLPLPEGLTYQNTYNGNASVTYDVANQQIVIDWVEGQAKQVQLTLLAEASGTYSLQASTIREDNPVESAPISIEVETVKPEEEEPATSDSAVADGTAEEQASADEPATDKKEPSLQTDSKQLQETSKTFNDWFPDDGLAEAVADEMQKQPTDTVTDTQLATVTSLYCFWGTTSDMTGLEYLTGLTSLNCSDNNLSELDVSQNPNLTDLDCSDNNLTNLDVSQNPNLTDLDCSDNNLTNLDMSQNPNLITLYCSHNNLTNLDMSHNPKLENLIFNSSNLTNLDVSQSPNLIWLECINNNLSELDLSHNLKLGYLSCMENNLSELDLSHNPNLTVLKGSNNNVLDFSSVPDNIDSIDALSQTRALPEQTLPTNAFTIAVDENLKDEFGNKMNITPNNGGIYDSATNTITWTNLADAGTVSYDFTSTSRDCGGTISIPYKVLSNNLSCDDEITYVQGTTKSAADFLTDIHATTDSDNVLSSDFATVVNMSQPGDYQVTVKASDPNLGTETTKAVTVHVIPYTLRFNTAPTNITFETSAVEKGQATIQREETDLYNFGVEDTRAADAHWSVTARIDEPLTNAEGDALDNALVYQKENGQETILTPGNAVEIANADALPKDDAQFDISWQENEGLLLDVDTNTVQSTTYQTTLYWELRDTP